MTTLALFGAGLALLVVGGELLVRGASRLAASFGISPLVVGLTVVAFGTSAPELSVSLQAAYRGQADLAVGNVVGSNIFNVLLILGISALITPLVVHAQLVRIEVPLMVAASFAVPLLALDGRVGPVEGGLLLGAGAIYTVVAIRRSRAEAPEGEGESLQRKAKPTTDLVLVVVGLALLVLGARWLVVAAVDTARAFGVSELVVGLTIVAAGTSLPEVAASVIAALRNQRDIAVGNVVGSNIFNLFVVLGGTALATPEGVAVSAATLRFDIPVMIAAAVACLPIFASGHRIDRWEGGLFLGFYAAYVAVVVLVARSDSALPQFMGVMFAFVLPLTLITLGLMTWRTWFGRKT